MNTSRSITDSACAWLAVACLGLLVACGGGGEDSDAGVPARAGSADIGNAGGSVDAVLEGGTTVELVVPSGALTSTTTLRIDPEVAPDGSLGEFSLSPADLVPLLPITVVVTLPAGAKVDADSTLAFETEVGPVAADATLDAAARTLTLSLSEFPAAIVAQTTSQSAGRSGILAARPAPRVTIRISHLSYAEKLSELAAAIDRLRAAGSDRNATIVSMLMTAVLHDARGPAEPAVHAAAGPWAAVVCVQQQSSVSALNTFAGVDIQTFEQRAKDVFVWDRHALALNAAVARMAPAEPACPGVPDDFAEPVRARLPAFLANVRQALDVLDPEVAADLAQLTGVRFVELLNLAADFAATGLVDLQNAVVATVSGELDHMRAIAYASCRGRRDQTLQARLISALSADPRLNALVPDGWDRRVLEDVQFCGMALRWKAVDAQGVVLQQGDAGGIAPGVTVTNVALTLGGAAKVVLSGPLAALVCPLSSQNNEQLVFSTGPATGAATGAQTLTPSNANGYLEASSLDFDVATLQGQGAQKLQIARQGGLCNGDFSILAGHATIATFALNTTASPLQIFTTSLFTSTVGAPYQTRLAATGGTPPLVWAATGLPAGLSVNSATGDISGTPTSAGIASVAITVRGADGATALATLGLTIIPNVVGSYVGTEHDPETGATRPFSIAVTGGGGDRVFVAGFLCTLAPSGGLTWLGPAIGFVPLGPPPVPSPFVGQFSGTTLTFTLAPSLTSAPGQGGHKLGLEYVFVKQ